MTKTWISLADLANDRIEYFLSKVPPDIYLQMREPMTWSEKIGEEEFQFEVEVLEALESEVHIGVSVSTYGICSDPLSIPKEVIYSSSFLMNVHVG